MFFFYLLLLFLFLNFVFMSADHILCPLVHPCFLKLRYLLKLSSLLLAKLLHIRNVHPSVFKKRNAGNLNVSAAISDRYLIFLCVNIPLIYEYVYFRWFVGKATKDINVLFVYRNMNFIQYLIFRLLYNIHIKT